MKKPKSTAQPWRNAKLPLSERLEALIGAMTLPEKISQLTNQAPAIPRLGLRKCNWDNECLHGLCNKGRATQFPMPIGLGASFDAELVRQIASATGDEARARHHDPAWRKPDGTPLVGLSFFTPVVNILRDPRWGRCQETYGEDPCLTSILGAAFVRGLQGDDPRYLKAAACAKHLAVQSGPENLRRTFDARVTKKDLTETYLPAFAALVEAGVATVMATYNRVNGEHCCASPTLIEKFLRQHCGYQGMVMSDGGALKTVHLTHKVTRDAIETAGLCLRAGCDFELGFDAYPHIAAAMERGLLTDQDVDRALARVLTVRFRVGEFDPPAQVPYARPKKGIVQCPEHIALARQAAVKSMVLLKNNGILPLDASRRVVLVTGPTAADLQVLLGNFYRGMSGQLNTILEGVVASAPNGTVVTHMQGCFLVHDNLYPSDWHLGLSDWADVVVAAVGYSPLMEGEEGECIGSRVGGDKGGIDLPPAQLKLLRDLKARGKPIVAVVTGGAPMALGEVHEIADAVLLAWYPGEQGGLAVGDLLFGEAVPSGKLPVTFPQSLDQVPPFEDYNMAGRTYRYMEGEPLYPFGFGLSYTRFRYQKLKLSKRRVKAGDFVTVAVELKNAGDCTAEEVVQLYLTAHDAPAPTPRCSLKAFKRVRLAAGRSKEISFTITPAMMHLINADGESVLAPGKFTVLIGGCSPGARGQALGAPRPVSGIFEIVSQ